VLTLVRIFLGICESFRVEQSNRWTVSVYGVPDADHQKETVGKRIDSKEKKRYPKTELAHVLIPFELNSPTVGPIKVV